MGTGSLKNCQSISHSALKEKGFGEEQINLIESSLESAFDIKFVFNQFTLGRDFCKNVLKVSDNQLDDFSFDMLNFLTLSLERSSSLFLAKGVSNFANERASAIPPIAPNSAL